MTEFSHLDEQGQAHMVEVGAKAETVREARAVATIRMAPETLARLHDSPKGDVLAAARLAGIMAAKKTSELIPLCHPLSLTGCDVTLEVVEGALEVTGTVRCTGRTGVEMEAMTAVSVAALTIYDMMKSLDNGIEIGSIRLLHKSGGKSGLWTR